MANKILMVSDSYFQFIIESNLRSTIYKNDVVDLLMYDNSVGAKDVYNRIKDLGFFRNVFLGQSPLLFCGNKITQRQKINKYTSYLKSLAFPESVLKNILPMNMDNQYDIVIFNSWGAMISAVFNYCYRRNPNVICYRIEEGIASALSEWHDKRDTRLKIERTCAKLFRTNMLTDYVKGIYFFEPQLVQFKSTCPILSMPKLSRDNKSLCDFIFTAFDLYTMHDKYEQKFIIFEDGNTFFADSNDDLEIIKAVVDVVGVENVFVKLHPRTKVNRFEPMGITTNKDIGIPWEAIMLFRNFNHKVFITTSSGAAMTGLLYFNDNSNTIMNFKCMKHQQSIVTPLFLKYLSDVQQRFGNNKLNIPNNMTELTNIIRQLS